MKVQNNKEDYMGRGCSSKVSGLKILGLAFLICIGLTCGFPTQTLRAEDAAGSGVISQTDTGEYQPYFVRLELPKTRLYQGEQVPLSINLYITGLNVVEVNSPLLNQKELAFGTLSRASQSTQTIGGHKYRVVRFSTTITPLKTGKLVLNPITVICKIGQKYAVTMADGRQYERVVQKNLEVASAQTRLNILPLPESNQPVDFGGGIGQFRINAYRNSTNPIRQGEPFKVQLTVTGRGNLSSIGMPYLKTSPLIQSFAAERKPSTRSDQAVYETTVVVQDAKIKNIGPFLFVYFNPNNGKYETAQAALPVTVTIVPGTSSNQTEQSPRSKDDAGAKLAPVKENATELNSSPFILLEEFWFWLLQLIPILLWIVCMSYRNYQRMLKSDLPQSRAIKAAAKSGKRLNEAKILLDEGKYEGLLEELHFILREFLSERFNLAASGMTGAVASVLAEKEDDLPPQALEDIKAFFAEYDRHRFAGTEFQRREALRLWEIVNSVIAAINRIPTERSKRSNKEITTASGTKGGSNHV